ncbi:LysR substrate-binding domain-containing protein [Oceanibacterium hippocampi]|nr:LysR substrate-binding domain-containing protein [Oceanibacterium hippocampi]
MLRMFDAAARHLNFRRAADELNLTPGAVAQQVRRLEADLGVPLFLRQARGLALTESGASYHAPLRRAFTIIEQATRELRPENARITLSMTPSFAAKWLVPRLGRFAERHPDIDLHTMASERLADFRSDGIDLAIRQGRPPFGKGLEWSLLARLDLCAVCSPEFGKTVSAVDHIGALADRRLIQDSHRYWEALLADTANGARHRIMQFNQTALAMDAAANGQGIALVPRLLLGSSLAEGRLVVLWQDGREDQGGYYVVQPAQRKSNAARDAVLEWLRSEVT